MAKKKQFKEPSKIGLILTALVGIALGSMLGVSILLSTPAQKEMRSPKEDPNSHGKYAASYVQGRVSGANTALVRANLGKIENKQVGDIIFSEADLNYFFNRFKTEAKTPEGESAGFKMDPPNIRLLEDEMVIAVPLVISPSADRFDLLVQVYARFEATERGPEFVVDNVKMNSMPIPGLGGAITAFVTSQIQKLPLPEGLVEGWKSIEKIEVGAGALHLSVGRPRA